MHILVCVKQTPDSSSVYVDPITGQVDYERFVQVLNPADACAIEAAVRLKEQLGSDTIVTALTVGPADAEGTLRATLAIGADSAIRLWQPGAEDWEPATVASALASYIFYERTPAPDLIFCGDAAIDWASGIVGPALAELLNLPQITGVTQLELLQPDAQNLPRLRLVRKLERGYREILEARPSLLITVTGDLNEPRYPSLPAHMAALRASIPVLDPAALNPSFVPEAAGETHILETHIPRPRPKRIIAPDSHHSAFQRIGEIVSGGATGRQTRLFEGTPEELAQILVDFLQDKGFLLES